MNINEFDWGWMNGDSDLAIFHKRGITREIFTDKIYEKIRPVQQGDVILDIGASIGPFTYSILDKKPARVICVEPSLVELPILEKNVNSKRTTTTDINIIPKGIGSKDGYMISDQVFGPNGGSQEFPTITFKSLIEQNDIGRVNFLKTDCEGGEYSIFNLENIDWIKDNVDFIVGEWHLNTSEFKLKFREFRDTFLKVFPNFNVFSIDGVDIKWDLWNEHFIEYYTEVIFYISNE